MLNEYECLETLQGYYVTEPTISVNALTYKISWTQDDDGLLFFAVHSHHVACIVRVPNDLWVQLDCGLKIAYMYNCVLTHMEGVIRST